MSRIVLAQVTGAMLRKSEHDNSHLKSVFVIPLVLCSNDEVGLSNSDQVVAGPTH